MANTHPSHAELTASFRFHQPSTLLCPQNVGQPPVTHPWIAAPDAIEPLAAAANMPAEAAPATVVRRSRSRVRTEAVPQPQAPQEPFSHEAGVFSETVGAHMDAAGEAVRTRGVQIEPRTAIAQPVLRTEPRAPRHRTPIFTRGVVSALLRMLLPLLAMLGGVFLLITHWSSIQPVLVQAAATWIVSYLLVAVLSRHHLSAGDIAGVATVLAIVFLVIGYNVFGIGNSVQGIFSSMIASLLPIVLLILGMIFLLRAIFR